MLLAYCLALLFVTGAIAEVFYHRYVGHQAFKLSPRMESAIMYLGSALGMGSPITWALLHRYHHAYTGTDKDPHPVELCGWRAMLLPNKPKQFGLGRDLLKNKRLVRGHKTCDRIHNTVVMVCLIGGFLFENYYLLVTAILPLFYIRFLERVVAVYLLHKIGYRLFPTKDDSRNCVWAFPFIFGGAWHNNHHRYPNSADYGVLRYEIDPYYWLIKLIGYDCITHRARALTDYNRKAK